MTSAGLNNSLNLSRHALDEFSKSRVWGSILSSNSLSPKESLLVFFAWKLKDVFRKRIDPFFDRKPKMLDGIQVWAI